MLLPNSVVSEGLAVGRLLPNVFPKDPCRQVGRPGWSFVEMSLDKSLRKGGGLTRARNVLTRAERLALLQEDDRWSPSAGVFNLPKTKFRRLAPGQSGPRRPEARQVSAGGTRIAAQNLLSLFAWIPDRLIGVFFLSAAMN